MDSIQQHRASILKNIQDSFIPLSEPAPNPMVFSKAAVDKYTEDLQKALTDETISEEDFQKGMSELDTLTEHKVGENVYFQKGVGEGSKGGKVIGHTKSGSPIYANKEADHGHYDHFTNQDHDDAMMAHHKKADKATDKTVKDHHWNMAEGHKQMKDDE